MMDSDRFKTKDLSLAVIGVGRVGLPLAVAFANAGLDVVGVDRDAQYLRSLTAGSVPFKEEGLDAAMHEALMSERLRFSLDAVESIAAADAVVVCVGTPLSSELRPNYQQLLSGLDSLARGLRPNKLVILRSTVSPGTVTQVIEPHLRERTGLTAGEDYMLAACPERVAEGVALAEIAGLPEIVGGVGDVSSQAAKNLFARLNPDKPIRITDPTSAELAKLFTNVYRYVNFALANEYAYIAETYGRDAREIIELVNADYKRADLPKPGPAAGPCLFKDGYFLIENLNMPDFVLMAWKVNESVPVHMARRLLAVLRQRGIDTSHARVTVLGRGFKADSDDDRYSPAVRLAEVLVREGADVLVHDPYMPCVDLTKALTDRDAVIVATNHREYYDLDPAEIAKLSPGVILADCWDVFDPTVTAEADVPLVSFGLG